jgi:Domain of unknown function (DUF4436)
MSFLGKITRVLVVFAVLLVYVAVLRLGLTEEDRRSLIVSNTPNTGKDFVTISVKVTSIDTTQGLLNERIRLIPSGRFAIDKITPATDLKLLINSASGKQTVVFPKGERIFPVEFSSLLSGNQNRYPFDNYTTNIDLLVTAPVQRAIVPVANEPLEDSSDPIANSLVIGTSDLEHSETLSIREDFTASLPGIKFFGTVAQDQANKLMHTTIAMRRANNVVSVSVIVMTIMFGLAISIMGMVLQMTASRNEINLIPLSLCVALIFGLPALRNIQPGVPGVGVLSDYISFIWAEFIVSTSAIALAWTWIIRSRRKEGQALAASTANPD